jgi:hypothetical protein
MNAIQYVTFPTSMAKPRSVPIELWQEMTEEDDVIEPRTLTLSDRDRDLFLAALERMRP